ncbi:phage baseplate assembly protein V [Sphingomonas sp. AOB5]|uniref:phage baseplate assembly protein V n=1 Tax=Sphingomonas sp. AOB5 TaxID=3034017 RepID=UPI0023F62B01|nr:phage baseplate assembly protein V [Sphingomonas sp. AOB5]MDF7777837.1 phage baseplate assembly protein V [Sphingomonas sp. AOB5]
MEAAGPAGGAAMKAMEDALRRLSGRIQMAIGRCIVMAVDDGRKFQELQVQLLADEVLERVERFQDYGITSVPRRGAEGVVLGVGGLRSHAIAICVGDRRYRLTGLQEGEVALHDDQGQKVLIGREGIVISSDQGVSIETEGNFAVAAEGTISLAGQGGVSIEGPTGVSIDGGSNAVTVSGNFIDLDAIAVDVGAGASAYAARRGDAINDSTDTILGGSSSVRIA